MDRVVAVVDGRVLTQSQLELEARVALAQRAGAAAASAPLDDDALRAALEYAIAQRLTSDEDKLQAFPVDDAEVNNALRGLKDKLGGEKAFERFLAQEEADVTQVMAILARGIRSERLLDNRVRLRARVSEAELRRYYDEHPEVQTRRYEEARSLLLDKLTRERYQQLVAQEIAQARRTADVRLVAPWARGEKEGG